MPFHSKMPLSVAWSALKFWSWLPKAGLSIANEPLVRSPKPPKFPLQQNFIKMWSTGFRWLMWSWVETVSYQKLAFRWLMNCWKVFLSHWKIKLSNLLKNRTPYIPTFLVTPMSLIIWLEIFILSKNKLYEWTYWK